MDRKVFLQSLTAAALGSRALLANEHEAAACSGQAPDALARTMREKEFIENWLTDLLDAMRAELDDATFVKLVEGCGRGCYRRHAFKQDIAAKGRGSVERLVDAYKQNFEVWRADDGVHIRYGSVSKGCYCPVMQNRRPLSRDPLCECTRTTHQTIFEEALGRPVKVEVVESLRRGGKTCHFLARV